LFTVILAAGTVTVQHIYRSQHATPADGLMQPTQAVSIFDPINLPQ
jgi:hypothetical protein